MRLKGSSIWREILGWWAFCAAPCPASRGHPPLPPPPWVSPPQSCSGCRGKREPPSWPGLFANSFSYKQTLPCDIVAVMGKRFVSFQSCYVGRLLRNLSVFSSHINMLPVTAPNTFCSKFQAILLKGVGWMGER